MLCGDLSQFCHKYVTHMWNWLISILVLLITFLWQVLQLFCSITWLQSHATDHVMVSKQQKMVC